MSALPIVLAVVSAVVGLAVVALNFYACGQAERHHLRSYIPNPHWQAEAAIDLITGVVVAVAAVVVMAALLR